MFSAGLYFFIATILVVIVAGHYKGHYQNKVKLTVSQRTLILQTIGFLVYLLSSAAVFAHIENWEYLDAVYWADCTILTIGLGDFTPITNLGRALLFPFAIGGIIILGLIVSSIQSLVLDRGKFFVNARMMEKQRQRVFKAQKQNDQTQDGLTERQRQKQEFELVRHAQDYAMKKRRWIALVISGSAWFILWLVSAVIFRATERAQSWSYFESVYFSFVSLLTIGYGDFYPQSSSGKAFYVFWSLLAIPTLTILISNMGRTVAREIRDVTLLLGNFTILPDEEDIKTTLKRVASKFTTEKTPGKRTGETPCITLAQKKYSTHKSQNPNLGSASNAEPNLVPQVEEVGENSKSKVFLKSRKDLYYLLIKEIVKVMKDVNNSPPRKYTFEEWEWYLKLLELAGLGMCVHWMPPGGRTLDGEELGIIVCECGDRARQEAKERVKWSWVGNRSPLMWNEEEPEWLLERLTKMLERELEIVEREELEQNNGSGRVENVNSCGAELSKD
jgi:potassium channel subfamily K